MLYQFLNTNRTALVDRCRDKVARRSTSTATPAQLEYGIPLFLEQLIQTLRQEQATGSTKATRPPEATAIGATAMKHGLELAQQGFTIDQVVHGYGDLCQAVTEMAGEARTDIEVDEFKTLNRCLDDAIAGAVKEFSRQRDCTTADRNLQVSGDLLHELQGHLQTATLALTAMKTGSVGVQGATGAVLDLSLVAMKALIERSLRDAAPTSAAAATPARRPAAPSNTKS